MGSTRRFEPTPEQRSTIEAKIADCVVGQSFEGARWGCKEAHALPLFLDWSACMAIRPDGVVVWIDYDEPDSVRAVEDERERNIGLFQGSLRDPDLGFLIPSRPLDAIDCSHCGGTVSVGPSGFPDQLANQFVCYCGGLGWLPALSESPKERVQAGRRSMIRKLLFLVAIPPILLTLYLLGFFQ